MTIFVPSGITSVGMWWACNGNRRSSQNERADVREHQRLHVAHGQVIVNALVVGKRQRFACRRIVPGVAGAIVQNNNIRLSSGKPKNYEQILLPG